MAMHRIGLSRAWEPFDAGPGLTGWIRRFGRPRSLDPHERVCLVVEAVGPRLAVRLNGGPVEEVPAGAERWASEITQGMRDRNELVVTCDGLPPEPTSTSRQPLPAVVATFSMEIVTGE